VNLFLGFGPCNCPENGPGLGTLARNSGNSSFFSSGLHSTATVWIPAPKVVSLALPKPGVEIPACETVAKVAESIPEALDSVPDSRGS